MLDNICTFFADFTVNDFPLWVVLLICVGVFLASFMDAIAGGGGIIWALAEARSWPSATVKTTSECSAMQLCRS